MQVLLAPCGSQTCPLLFAVGSASTLASMPANASVYGLTPSAACCAFLNLADATSFIAEVIFSVLRTDAM
jgi:hypothetical protein